MTHAAGVKGESTVAMMNVYWKLGVHFRTKWVPVQMSLT